MTENPSDFLRTVLASTPGYEAEVFDRYSRRLIAFAASRLPHRIHGRVDSEDIVQSVFLSFFQRHERGEFRFDESTDLWRLLAAMTYRRVQRTVKHHGRHRRDARRDRSTEDSDLNWVPVEQHPGPAEVNLLVDYVARMFELVPESTHRILQLRLDGFAISEIAQQTHVSQRTVKRVLAQVRQRLADYLLQSESDSPERDGPGLSS